MNQAEKITVPKKKLTNRKKESIAKKKLIYDKAMELFSVYGYANTSIADISNATGMSVGSIYHYYYNKEAILLELSMYMSQVEKLQNNIEEKAKNPYAFIFHYLIDYAKNWEKLGVNLTKQIYNLFDRAYLSEDHTQKKLIAYEQLTSYIELAQKKGAFDQSISAAKACAYLMTFCRGLIFEWILFDGSFSLTKKAREMLPRILKTFIGLVR